MINIVNGLLLRDQHVLLAHRTPTRARYPNSWSFPGGQVEPGETLDQALTRELSEEIGVQATDWTFVRRFEDRATRPDHPVAFHIFAVTSWRGTVQNIGDEHNALRWLPLTEAASLPDLTFPIYAELIAALAD